MPSSALSTLAEAVERLGTDATDAEEEFAKILQQENLSNDLKTAEKLVEKNLRKRSQELKQLKGQLSALNKQLSTLTPASSIEAPDSPSRQLQSVLRALASIEPAVHLADVMQEYDNVFGHGTLEDVATVTVQWRDALEALKSSSADIPPRVLQDLQSEFRLRWERICYDCDERWSELVSWVTEQEKGIAKLTIVRRPLSGVSLKSSLEDCLSAYKILGLFAAKLEHFKDCLVTYFVEPITRSMHDRVRVEMGKGDVYIDMKISTTDAQVTSEDVLSSLRVLFGFVAERFQFESLAGVPEFLGSSLCTPLWHLLAEHCVKPAGPNAAELDSLLEQTEDFENYLKTLGLLSQETPKFKDQIGDLDTLFVDKKCQNLLLSAREALRKNLFDHVTVENGQLANLPGLDRDKDWANELHFGEKELEPILSFPKCEVSTSIQSYLSLFDQSIIEARKANSLQAAARYCTTARSIAELYADLVLLFHDHDVATLPQLTALFYNNCYYVAYHFSLPQPEPRSGSALAQLIEEAGTELVMFADLVPRLRNMGRDVFGQVMRNSKAMLTEAVDSCGGFVHIAKNEQAATTCRRSLKQIELQLSQNSRLWREVLPLHVALRATASLSAHTLSHIVSTFLALEDIREDDAQLSIDLIEPLLLSIESLFETARNPAQVNAIRYCSRAYPRLKELLFVLRSSLQDIQDRWADGLGPLAQAFEPSEVHGLIRALFQNTQKRANVLGSITK